MATKSIIQNDKEKCFLCGRTGTMECHHVFGGTANRRLADADGLTVYLCPQCHHQRAHGADREAIDYLKETAQKAWMDVYGKTTEDFIRRYGKNYIIPWRY